MTSPGTAVTPAGGVGARSQAAARSIPATDTPDPASVAAVAAPSPEAAPVTTADEPVSSIGLPLRRVSADLQVAFLGSSP